ncbi:hypothetical protein SBD_5078 [Streptomyces bottropensis ATCC 25435]|uniref:Uncharacterized protein n=1 Tax=Streptomyces bottropensis ATCC 25435 TaxID=1054862 RepID=M3FN55_9ACTN|nr:hypothetical protein SBD_5078 [Streptomyces bottropensis ATCC 25435]
MPAAVLHKTSRGRPTARREEDLDGEAGGAAWQRCYGSGTRVTPRSREIQGDPSPRGHDPFTGSCCGCSTWVQMTGSAL